MATPVLNPKAASSSPTIGSSRRSSSILDAKLSASSPGRWGVFVFALLLIGGLFYIGHNLYLELDSVHLHSVFPFILLGVALLIALGFEFVNGFLDTATAVATVIYTHSLDPHIAVVYSGVLNFVGVLLSSGAVAFAIIGLLPVELLLKISNGSGFSMVFAVLIAAIAWNLTAWFKALPISSSHTMIGSILGVALAYRFTHGSSTALDWNQIKKVLEALLISPIIGFVFAGLVLLLFKLVARDPRLYKEPEGTAPPPFYIRALLVLTCGGVSYAHGSNDGQKGMGLIMLILVGTVPSVFALNHHVSLADTQGFAVISTQASAALSHYITPDIPPPALTAADAELKHFISTCTYDAALLPALQLQINTLRSEIASAGSLATVPPAMQSTVRNQMYLSSETVRILAIAAHAPHLAPADAAVLVTYRGYLDRSTRFIPIWVKVAVALALGLGTMIGWKRIVITVGEKIGKTHLTYAQGAAAQITAMITIGLADGYGLPVSTTHVLSSGVAGTMAANRSGLQLSTVRDIALAWVFTLPAAAMLSGCLFILFSKIAG